VCASTVVDDCTGSITRAIRSSVRSQGASSCSRLAERDKPVRSVEEPPRCRFAGHITLEREIDADGDVPETRETLQMTEGHALGIEPVPKNTIAVVPRAHGEQTLPRSSTPPPNDLGSFGSRRRSGFARSGRTYARDVRSSRIAPLSAAVKAGSSNRRTTATNAPIYETPATKQQRTAERTTSAAEPPLPGRRTWWSLPA